MLNAPNNLWGPSSKDSNPANPVFSIWEVGQGCLPAYTLVMLYQYKNIVTFNVLNTFSDNKGESKSDAKGKADKSKKKEPASMFQINGNKPDFVTKKKSEWACNSFPTILEQHNCVQHFQIHWNTVRSTTTCVCILQRLRQRVRTVRVNLRLNPVRTRKSLHPVRPPCSRLERRKRKRRKGRRKVIFNTVSCSHLCLWIVYMFTIKCLQQSMRELLILPLLFFIPLPLSTWHPPSSVHHSSLPSSNLPSMGIRKGRGQWWGGSGGDKKKERQRKEEGESNMEVNKNQK